jgi:ribose 5-phosphate isomerase
MCHHLFRKCATGLISYHVVLASSDGLINEGKYTKYLKKYQLILVVCGEVLPFFFSRTGLNPVRYMSNWQEEVSQSCRYVCGDCGHVILDVDSSNILEDHDAFIFRVNG